MPTARPIFTLVPRRAQTNAEKQRRYRARAKRLQIVREALFQQAIDSGLTEAEATAESFDKAKTRAQMDAVLVEWADFYLGRK